MSHSITSLDAQTNTSFISLQPFGSTAGHVREISKHFTECIICNTRNTNIESALYSSVLILLKNVSPVHIPLHRKYVALQLRYGTVFTSWVAPLLRTAMAIAVPLLSEVRQNLILLYHPCFGKNY